MKRLFLLIYLLSTFCITNSWAKQDSIVNVAKSLLLTNEMDSLELLIPQIVGENNEKIKNVLIRLSKKETLTYLEYWEFVETVRNERVSTAPALSEFIKANVSTPTSNKINYNFALIKWAEIDWLINDNYLDEAALAQVQFEEYVAQFDTNERDVKRAKILTDSYHLIIYQINGVEEQSSKILDADIQIIKEVKDTNLWIMLRFFQAGSFFNMGKLDAFIEHCEFSLELDSYLENHSPYYQPTVLQLIDAYFYKGGNENEALALLDKLYENENTRSQTYSYYPSYVANIKIPSRESEAIFNRFGVTDMVGFAEKIREISQEIVNSNEYYYVLYTLSVMFEKHGDLENAILYTRESNQVIKRTYRTEMAESLAAHKTSLLKKEQELVLAKVEEKSKMYSIVAVLTGLIAVLAISYLLLRRNKERQLELKNNEITLQRDEIKKRNAEKSLLLKEIHHRVKNNFQVVSSLLELQSAGIEDEKAKAVAIEGKNRINSMALIHKKLYENEDLQMFFDDYINKLVSDLSKMYGKSENLELNINVPHVAFDIDTAIPLGLIINELVTNSLKYGLTNEKPVLEVSIEKLDSQYYLLHVKDNGEGLPEGLQVQKLKSLGLQLVQGLAKQLQGKLTFTNDNGTHIHVSFKDTYARAAIE